MVKMKIALVVMLFLGINVAEAAITSNLTVGSRGLQVVELQQMLVSNGHLVMPRGVAYGYFGSLTRAAVARWQVLNGVLATGFFGPISRSRLNVGAMVPVPLPTPAPFPPPPSDPISIVTPPSNISSWVPPLGIPHPGNWFLATTGSVQEVTSGGTSRTFSGEGTANAPVIFRGVNNPTFTGTVTINGSYVIVENITVTGGGVVRISGDHNVLRNSEVMNNNRRISSLTLGVGGSTDTVIYKNRIHDNGDWQSSEENDVHGIGGGGVTEKIWILENEMHHHGGDSIQFGHNGGNKVKGVYVGRNTMHHDRENAVDIKEASDFIVSENTMYGYRQTSSSEGAAVVVHYCPINAHIANNLIYDSTVGISSSSNSSACAGLIPTAKFTGNVIRDIIKNGFQAWGSNKVTQVVGNTFRNIGGNGVDISNASAGSLVENNTFENVAGRDIDISGGNVIQRNNIADTRDP